MARSALVEVENHGSPKAADIRGANGPRNRYVQNRLVNDPAKLSRQLTVGRAITIELVRRNRGRLSRLWDLVRSPRSNIRWLRVNRRLLRS